MIFLYQFIVSAYGLLLRLASFWHPKAKAFVQGRRADRDGLAARLSHQPRIWMHCASAGEFEQGRPLIEALLKDHPGFQLVVSFFSPSGMAAGEKAGYNAVLCYLPIDSPSNAEWFVSTIDPELAIFVKYEYWLFHLRALRRHDIPHILVSAHFRRSQVFFKSWGKVFRKALRGYRHLFVQTEASAKMLATLHFKKMTVAGDTRFDRVVKIAADAEPLPEVAELLDQKLCLVCGSTWPEDESLIAAGITTAFFPVLVPHEIDEGHIQNLLEAFPGAARLSTYTPGDACTALIVDSYGKLSKIYRYASVAYIGGGFNKSGIHNTLEAAAWGVPVLFGTAYQKFAEAVGLVEAGAAHSVQSPEELKAWLTTWSEVDKRQTAANAATAYVAAHQGATERIMHYLRENRLLTIE